MTAISFSCGRRHGISEHYCSSFSTRGGRKQQEVMVKETILLDNPQNWWKNIKQMEKRLFAHEFVLFSIPYRLACKFGFPIIHTQWWYTKHVDGILIAEHKKYMGSNCFSVQEEIMLHARSKLKLNTVTLISNQDNRSKMYLAKGSDNVMFSTIKNLVGVEFKLREQPWVQ